MLLFSKHFLFLSAPHSWKELRKGSMFVTNIVQTVQVISFLIFSFHLASYQSIIIEVQIFTTYFIVWPLYLTLDLGFFLYFCMPCFNWSNVSFKMAAKSIKRTKFGRVHIQSAWKWNDVTAVIQVEIRFLSLIFYIPLQVWCSIPNYSINPIHLTYSHTVPAVLL